MAHNANRRTIYFLYICIIWICTGLFWACGDRIPKEVTSVYDEIPNNVDFNFHVKPILSDRCFSCHGPDENTRQAGLRLDVEESAFATLESGKKAISKGNADRSEVVNRLLTQDADLQMPPPESHLTVSDREKAIIIKWIEEGAEWKDHWSFIKPQTQEVPIHGDDASTAINEIDAFVLDKLKANNVSFSPESSKEILLRRLSMDIRGLPPSIEELDRFLADDSSDAYEKMVDEFLASDACAERLALDWMDLSRYADSHGLHADGWRNMWPWRDWVIQAFQKNMPYDAFVTWQLAGDLFPNATHEQKLATAFNRNNPMTGEGGVIDEEFRLNYVFDRAETTSTAFLGLTVACAKCHDHKFDPISQKDYFEMSAFFNNVREVGMTGDDGNFGPLLTLIDDSTQQVLDDLNAKISNEAEALELTKNQLSQTEIFIKSLPSNALKKDLIDYYPFDYIKKQKENKYVLDYNANCTVNKSSELTDGVKNKAIVITGDYDELYLNNLPNFEYTDAFSASIWVNTSKREAGKTQTILGTAGDKNGHWRGWDFYLDTDNHLNLRLISGLPHNLIHAVTTDSIQINTWNQLAFAYDGSGKAEGISLYINGIKAESKIEYNRLYKSIKSIQAPRIEIVQHKPCRVGKSYRAFAGDDGIFKGRMDELYVYNRQLLAIEITALYNKIESDKAIELDATVKADMLKTHWVTKQEKVRRSEKTIKQLREEELAIMNAVDEIMVMEEMPTSRTSYVYARGEYDQPADTVYPNTLDVLQAYSDDYPKNRLGLAQWLFDSENPLTARVAVNRYWQMIFGKGLVKTPHDFGVQGALPTHPELLDWLALYFMENNWDVKLVLKKMVMSHTYRQSSKPSQEVTELDPENVWLSHSNSYRLPAEFIRDNALAVSGLLANDIGGKSVKPYLPYDLWIEKSSFSYKLYNYIESQGDSLYRRGLYTFVRRTSPHPAMTVFDAPARDVCTVQRENTNTPLQALVLLNDVEFVEASRVMAERVLQEAGDGIDNQIEHAFRLATSRYPKEEELNLLIELYESQEKRFAKNPKEAIELLEVGAKSYNRSLDKIKTASLAMVTHTLLNHDETFMKR